MTSNTAALQAKYDEAWNAHDVDGVLAIFTDDAIVRTVPPLPGAPDQFNGKGEIRGFVQMLIPNFRVISRDVKGEENRVTWFATVTSDSVRGLGVDALDTDCEMTFRDGKATGFYVAFTADTLARLAAAAQTA